MRQESKKTPILLNEWVIKQESNYKLHGIKSEVIFGKPSKDCAGLGICKVNVNTKSVSTQNDCPASKAIIKTDRFGQVGFYFKNESLCIKARRKYFNSSYFVLGESFVLPKQVIQLMKLKHGVIEAGEYPILKMKSHTLVLFPVV